MGRTVDIGGNDMPGSRVSSYGVKTIWKVENGCTDPLCMDVWLDVTGTRELNFLSFFFPSVLIRAVGIYDRQRDLRWRGSD